MGSDSSRGVGLGLMALMGKAGRGGCVLGGGCLGLGLFGGGGLMGGAEVQGEGEGVSAADASTGR